MSYVGDHRPQTLRSINSGVSRPAPDGGRRGEELGLLPVLGLGLRDLLGRFAKGDGGVGSISLV